MALGEMREKVLAVLACTVGLSACAVGAPWPQPSEAEQRAIDAAIEAWELSGREPCDPDILGVVHTADDDEYTSYCSGPGWQQSAACYIGGVIVLRSDTKLNAYGEPLVHETLHALSDCRGLPDSAHDDREVWADLGERVLGGNDTVQAHARRIFAGE